ncbi:plasma membrane proteolipid 3 [Tricharina praecox]|uniref:plasma membrane proteolipid 3 n=1 Tax=Tricharina praecox TaxID=43433 RepID=UPI00221E5ECC|nr:plasma membrane proteolipid 3 [Tricharina praecox]KAI5854310.1 plasma membrane proteolipid 3 [Tricharina praecox]
MGFCSTFLLVLITILFPPLGVFFVAGCGADVLINICLTLLGYLPGHLHAFYVEYVYYERKHDRAAGVLPVRRAPGVYSERVQGVGTSYGTVGQTGV